MTTPRQRLQAAIASALQDQQPLRPEGRAQALELWRRVAAGDLDFPGLATWLQSVAADVVAADAEEAKRRPDAMLRALGLAGTAAPAAVLAAVREADDDCRLIEQGRGAVALPDGSTAPAIPGRKLERGERTKRRIARVRAAGAVSVDASDDEIRKLIARATEN